MAGNQMRRHVTQMKNTSSIRSSIFARRSELALTAELVIRFLLGFLLSGTRLFNGISPFGAAFTAASGAGAPGIAALIGVILGYIINCTIPQALKYIAISILVCAVAFVFRSFIISEQSWFMPAVAIVTTLCVGFVYAADTGWSILSIAFYISDIILIGSGALFYKIALSPWSGRFDFARGSETGHTLSVLLLIATVLSSLARIELFSVLSIGRAIAIIFLLLTAYKGGAGLGCACGVALGAAMDASGGGMPFFTMAYGIGGLVAGIFSSQGKLLFIISYILTNTVTLLAVWTVSDSTNAMYEAFAGSVLFMLIPNTLLSRIGYAMTTSVSGSGTLKAIEYTRKRIELASAAFQELYETVRSAGGFDRNDSDVATIFDRAAEAVCRDCMHSSACWQLNYETTFNVMNNAAPAMLERGSLLESDFPEFFRETCTNLPAFISAVNVELRGLAYRRQYRSRLRENQKAAFNQYMDMSTVLDSFSGNLSGDVGAEPFLERRLQKYLRSLNINADAAVFRDPGGRIHAEITSSGLHALTKDPEYLDKLSAALNIRLCTSSEMPSPERLIVMEAEPLTASVGIASLKKEAHHSSGDKGTYFKSEDGTMYVMLSDGMGSGDGAARYSGETIRILERFLRSGVTAETSVRILNDVMLLKNENDTGCATIDLICINLFTGETGLFKYGAAPSYIKSGHSVHKIKGKSLAAGLGYPPNDAPDYLRAKLSPESFAIIVSDGVTCGYTDEWLQDLIRQYSGHSPKELAREILKTASEKFGVEDDMTVIAVHIMERQ